MHWRKPLEVVFLTNFSDACFRSIPFVAQMADDICMNLTLLHAYDPETRRRQEAEAFLTSFFPEADHYSGTMRLAMAGTPVEALRKFEGLQQIDLVICPGSDVLGLPRLAHRSLRSRIAHECGFPIWTMGRGADLSRLRQPVRNVACWVDFAPRGVAHVRLAAEFATALGAKLHLLHAIPEMEEGAILPMAGRRPLHPEGVREEFLRLVDHCGVQPEVHVTSGESPRDRLRLVQKCDPDLVFASIFRSPVTDWFRSDLNVVDRFTCPTVCLSAHSPLPNWRLLPRGAATLQRRVAS